MGTFAWMTIQKTGRLIDEAEILNLLDEVGIKYGIDDAIRWMQENDFKKIIRFPSRFAMCQTPPAEARLNYFFETGIDLKETDGINLDSLKALSYVDQGFVLADYSYNLFDGNSSIYNIFGEMIALPDDKTEKLGLLAGVNTLYEEKTHRFIAQKSGYPYLDGQGRICIMDRISSAEIASGTVLRTPLSLDLSGNLENCTIISKGDITIMGVSITRRSFVQENSPSVATSNPAPNMEFTVWEIWNAKASNPPASSAGEN